MEIVLTIMAISSLSSCIIAYNKIKDASTDVDAIVENWKMKPIKDWQIKTKLESCPSGYETLKGIPFPGNSEGGCGCLTGSTALFTGQSSQQNVYSGSAKCFTNQTNNVAYKCRDVPNLEGFNTVVWRDHKFCYKRGFSAAIHTPYPDAATGECPAGWHKCGAGKFNADRAFCASDEEGASACPLTWLGSTNTLALFPGVTSGALSAGVAALDGSGEIFYHQQGQSSSNSVVNMGRGWSPLPIVNIETAFQSSDIQGPCYGVDVRYDEFRRVEQISTGYAAQKANRCEHKDTRFMPFNTWDLSSWWYTSRELHTACSSRPSSGAGSDPDVFSAGYNVGGDCLTSGPISSQCFSGQSPTGACPSNDAKCMMAYKQTKCGAYKSVAMDTGNLGIYIKSQIYWSQTCPYSYEQVVQNNSPLQRAIDWQTALLYVNIIINAGLILLSFYVIWITWRTIQETHKVPPDLFDTLENIVKPHFEFWGNWIKVPIVIVTIVFTSAIANFFTRLSKEKCSDSLSNETFDKLGEALPGVVTANIIVLVVDAIGLVPIMYKWLTAHFCPKKGGSASVAPALDMERQHMLEMESKPAAAYVAVASAPPKADVVEPVPVPALPIRPANLYPPRADTKYEYDAGMEVLSGDGKIFFPDGSHYSGGIYRKQRHNEGTMNFVDGTVYVGHWNEGKRHGQGTLTYNGNILYQGNWTNDQQH